MIAVVKYLVDEHTMSTLKRSTATSPPAVLRYYYYDQLGSAYTTSRTSPTCGSCRASSRRSSRSGRRWDSTATNFYLLVNPGVDSWP